MLRLQILFENFLATELKVHMGLDPMALLGLYPKRLISPNGLEPFTLDFQSSVFPGKLQRICY